MRREMARRGELLGAIRLPGGAQGAFAQNAGTDVTTDIVFLKRRAEGEIASAENWLTVAQIDTPDGPATINRYFAENPHMMLGEMRLQGTMYSEAEPVLIGPVEGIAGKIAEAAARMSAKAFVPRAEASEQPVCKPMDVTWSLTGFSQ